MSFASFFETLFTTAEKALTEITPIVQPVVTAAEELAPIVKTIVPSAAPVIDVVTAAKNSIEAVAPTAVQDATAAINVARQAYTDLGPAVAALEASIGSLFHVTATPQAIVLTPKTTAATVPAATPSTAPVAAGS